MPKNYSSRRNSRKSYKKPVLILGGILILVALLVAISEITNTTHWFHSAAAPSTNGAPNDGSSAITPTQANGQSSHSSADKTQPAKSPQSAGSTTGFSGTLVAPYGRFVSQHNPSSLDYVEQSACITSAGVSCTISFTSGSKTIALRAETTDGSGTAYWSWTPRQYGLTAGSWTITAIAKAGGQQKSTVDPNGQLVIP